MHAYNKYNTIHAFKMNIIKYTFYSFMDFNVIFEFFHFINNLFLNQKKPRTSIVEALHQYNMILII